MKCKKKKKNADERIFYSMIKKKKKEFLRVSVNIQTVLKLHTQRSRRLRDHWREQMVFISLFFSSNLDNIRMLYLHKKKRRGIYLGNS